MKAANVTTTVIESVDHGDIFQVINGPLGCHALGSLLVVYEVRPIGDLLFVAPEGIGRACGSIKWIQECLNDGSMRYAGNIINPNVHNMNP